MPNDRTHPARVGLPEVPGLQDARTVHARIEFRSRLRRPRPAARDFRLLLSCGTSHSRSILLETSSICGLSMSHGGSGTSRGDGHLLAAVNNPGVSTCFADLSSSDAVVQHDGWSDLYHRHGGVATCDAPECYRTTETVILFSTHGAARLLECAGGLEPSGSFAVHGKLARTSARVGGAPAHQAEHLRDEMPSISASEIGVLPEVSTSSQGAHPRPTLSRRATSYRSCVTRL